LRKTKQKKSKISSKLEERLVGLGGSEDRPAAGLLGE